MISAEVYMMHDVKSSLLKKCNSCRALRSEAICILAGIPRPISSGDLTDRAETPTQSLDSDVEECGSHGKAHSGQMPVANPSGLGKKTSEGLLLDVRISS